MDPTLANRMGADTASAATAFASAGARLSVTADVENNSLLIQTTAREYERVERILGQLDVLPTQVLIEAVIAEVTLNDENRCRAQPVAKFGTGALCPSPAAAALGDDRSASRDKLLVPRYYAPAKPTVVG